MPGYPPPAMTSDHLRAFRFQEAVLARTSTRTMPIPWGTAYFNDDFPLRYDANMAIVDRPLGDAGDVGHGRVEVRAHVGVGLEVLEGAHAEGVVEPCLPRSDAVQQLGPRPTVIGQPHQRDHRSHGVRGV